MKIFPVRNIEHDTWFNYSNYLNWTYKKIEGWDSYLKFFSPNFKILNESFDVLNIIPKLSTETISEEIIEPAWKYTIVDDVNSTEEEVFCYFPSELKFREGYLNTHPNSYLCYFTPPDAFFESPLKNYLLDGNIQWRRTKRINKSEWNSLVESGSIAIFPISRLIVSNKWRHSGFQNAAHPDAFKKENYTIIAKASSAWYRPTTNLSCFNFSLYKNAAETIGSIVPFVIELSPSRYILQSPQEWIPSFKIMSLYASTWSSQNDRPEIFFKGENNDCIWTGSYPLMHELLVLDEGTYENFIIDESFSTEIRNVDNHATAVYNIITTYSTEETDTTLWENVYISVC